MGYMGAAWGREAALAVGLAKELLEVATFCGTDVVGRAGAGEGSADPASEVGGGLADSYDIGSPILTSDCPRTSKSRTTIKLNSD